MGTPLQRTSRRMSTVGKRVPVVVVGAGLTGSCVALALASRDVDVLLVDQDERAMNRASLRNEGKIHLGFVYANDPSLATSTLMLEGAVSFGSILSDLVGDAFQDVGISTPFNYLVAHDSLKEADDLEEFYEDLDSIYREAGRPEYLGTHPKKLARRLAPAEWTSRFSPSVVAAAFETAELAVDSDDLAVVVRNALSASSKIELRCGCTVDAVTASSNGYLISGTSREGSFQLEAEQVVNASWERRAAFDAEFGIRPLGDLLHRLKYRVIGMLPSSLAGGPSVTMVLGRYGDVVVRPNGSGFFSWYPVCLQGWTNESEPPRMWDEPCRGDVPPAMSQSIAEQTLSAIGSWYMGADRSQPIVVDAGVIVAGGMTDVNDPESALHRRLRVGVTSIDGYHSVDPGKLTTAPMFAVRAADRVYENIGRMHGRLFAVGESGGSR